MNGIVAMQTDFSLTWSAVSSMKGVMKIVDPSLDLQDICHTIKMFDPWEASLSLKTVVPYWPKGTVFVSVVDPGVGTNRKASVAELKNGNYVVSPDNGSFTHLKKDIVRIFELNQEKYYYRDNEEVNVFHGRDLFGYCGALLASNQVKIEEIGFEYPVEEIVMCPEFFEKPVLNEHAASGFIMTGLAHFGGVQMNITNAEWKQCGFEFGDHVDVTIYFHGNVVFHQVILYERSFGYVKQGEPILYCGSSEQLSLDCNMASFMDQYQIGFGIEWKVELKKVDK